MFLRRSATAFAAVAVLCTAAAPAFATVPAADPAGRKLPGGLFGTADPQYDGVWRQSVALLALKAAGSAPPQQAVRWLARQQCDDGSFAAYRAHPGKDCDAKKADTNATGIAVQALAAVGGHREAVGKSVKWLTSVQNEDGGWGFAPGSPSDANSVSVVLGALVAADEKPGSADKDGRTPYDALLALQLGCDAEPAERGAFAYQPDKKGRLAANDDATAAASLAASGQGMLVHKPSAATPIRPPDCEDDAHDDSPGAAAAAGNSRLASVLKENGGLLTSAQPGAEEQPDYANTADAVLALAAGGHRGEAERTARRLVGQLGKWDKAKDDPAAIGTVMLARHAVGADPSAAGGTDLLKRLRATGPASPKPAGEKEDGGSWGTWAAVGVGLAAGAGIGFLLSGRRKKQNR